MPPLKAKVSKPKKPAPVAVAGDSWDPLESTADSGMLDAVRRREITNILKSYTGYFDLFSELIQNALDALDERRRSEPKFVAKLSIRIDMNKQTVTVADNGCGMSFDQFRNFLRPNFSFKKGPERGSKGVGATYLGYGFNYLLVETRSMAEGEGLAHSGILLEGRKWVEDRTGTIIRPKVSPSKVSHLPEDSSGTVMSVKLSGTNIRPQDLTWLGATTAEQWMTILRIATPLGGLYIEEKAPHVDVQVTVISPESETTIAKSNIATYLYPHEVLGTSADLRAFLDDQKKRAAKHQDTTKTPSKFTQLNGIWGQWTGAQILSNESPMQVRLDASEKQLVDELGVRLYIYLAYSTDLWDAYNDKTLGLRKGKRIIRGGLQLATRNMPQGAPITIPLTNNIGFQNLAHVIVHMDKAEPDLGRKGFQPEHVAIAQRLAVSAVTAFRRYYDSMLRKSTGAPVLAAKMKLEQWVDGQKDHEKKNPLILKGTGLFMPAEELPIRSIPVVEQDVVSLFNQMLSSGVVRGMQILSSSQFEQYDGLYRVVMNPPLDRFTRSPQNPLGVEKEHFIGAEKEGVRYPVGVLEYKHTMDALFEEFQTEVKNASDVSLAVAWEMGTRWKEDFRVVSCLLEDNVQHRPFHGVTHLLSHATSGLPAFQVIILKDLISFLLDSKAEQTRQEELYGDAVDLEA